MHQIKVMDIPFQKLKEKGVPVDNISKYDSSREEMIFVCSCTGEPEQELIFVTAKGLIKRTPASEFVTNSRTVAATKLGEDDQLIYVDYYNKKQIILHSEKGSFLRFAAEEISTGKKNTLGQKGMSLADKDQIKEVWQVTPGEDLHIRTRDREIELKRIRLSSRGGRGIKLRL